jgi:hypothetical protein
METATPLRLLSGRQRAFLTALGHALVPETRGLPAERQAKFFEIIDTMLATRPKRVVRLLSIFLIVLRWLPLLRFGGRLDRLGGERQKKALCWFQDSPSVTVRTGFWAVKTLVYMGYYAQPGVAAGIGYTPSRAGNDKLHA